MVREMRRRRLGLDMGRDWGTGDACAIGGSGGAVLVVESAEGVDARGADEVAVKALGVSTWVSFQMRRPSIPPSTEIHSPEMWPAAR
jgi:hypothetical protein